MDTKEKPSAEREQALLRRLWLLFLALGAIFVLAAGVVTMRLLDSMRNGRARAETPGTPINQPAPGFTLRDQDGRLTTLAQFRGKVVALTFIDPVCTQLCPLTTRSLVGALRLLGPAASQVQLLGIDANPQKTKISDVAAYTRTHELEGRWRFLTGSPAELERVWKDYHIYVAVEKDDIEHTAVVVLIDGNGNERNVLSTPMSYEAVGDQAQVLAAGMAQLLPSHPPIPATGETTETAAKPPEGIATVNLTALGPKREPVVLGSAHPHLLLFFAGWMGPSKELKKNLAVLDSYAAQARERGWPSPVAVDVMPTEPSAAEARQVLEPLAATLETPIVEDSSGRLADDYHVDDLPWFVCNTASGEIVWRHDGWLSGASVIGQIGTSLAAKNHK